MSEAPTNTVQVAKHAHPNGSPCCEIPTVDGRKEGTGKLYYLSGKLYATETYAADDLDGPTVTYYESGAVQSELNYKAGRLDGVIKQYFPSGAIESEAAYVAGLREGKTTVYNEKGGVESVLDYHAGDIVPATPAAKSS